MDWFKNFSNLLIVYTFLWTRAYFTDYYTEHFVAVCIGFKDIIDYL